MEEPPGAFIERPAVIGCLLAVYALILVLGVVGNVMVLLAVARNRHMHSVANLLISNLAAADLLMAATCVPVTPVMTFVKKWLFGELMCHIIPMTSAVSVYVNTFTGIIIAIDRYIVIVHPLTQTKLAPRSTLVLIAAVWLFSVVFSLPLGVVQRLQVNNNTGDAFCLEQWPDWTASDYSDSNSNKSYSYSNSNSNSNININESWAFESDSPASASAYASASGAAAAAAAWKTIFDVCSFCLQWVIPSLLITFCYASVSVKLTQRLRDRARFSTRKDAKRAEAEVARNRRMNRMFSLVVASHALCWIPLNLFNLVDQPLGLDTAFSSYYMFVFMLTHVVAMSSVIYNPILYAWFNDKFRQEFTSMCSCLNALCYAIMPRTERDASDDSPNAQRRAVNGNSKVPLLAVPVAQVPADTSVSVSVSAVLTLPTSCCSD